MGRPGNGDPASPVSRKAWARCRTASIGIALMAACAMLPVRGMARDEPLLVEEYLTRLGLDDLRVLHLERTLERESEDPRRLPLAVRLADLYAERMLDRADEPKVFEAMSAGLERLLERYPRARSAAVEVARLQADYRRAELLFLRWMDDRAARDDLRQASAILARIAPILMEQQRELNAQVDGISQRLERLDRNADPKPLERELVRVAAIAARATYFAGWSSYYLAVTEPESGAARERWEQTRRAFIKVLELPANEPFEKLQAELLNLESVWRSRAMVGLALCAVALRLDGEATALFRLLESPQSHPTVRNLLSYWQLMAFLNVQRWTDAQMLAEHTVNAMEGESTPGKIAFCAALVRAGFAARGGPANDSSRGWIDAGVKGLTRIRAHGTLLSLLGKYDLPLGADAGISVLLAKGRQVFQQAEQSRKADDYKAAAAYLRQALSNPAPEGEPLMTAECRQLLAWCWYRHGDFEAAAKEFTQAAQLFSERGAGAGASAAWMAFVCHEARRKSNPAAKEAAVASLQWLLAKYPDCEKVKQAEFQLLRLRSEGMDREQRIAAYAGIEAAHPGAEMARAELCLLLYEDWRELGPNEPARDRRMEQLLNAVRSYFAIRSAAVGSANSGGTTSPEEIEKLGSAPNADATSRLSMELRIAMIGADVLLAAPRVDVTEQQQAARRREVGEWLARAEVLSHGLPESSGVVLELHYRQLQLAEWDGNQSRLRSEATFLSQKGAGSVFETPALLLQARRLDESLRKVAPDAESERTMLEQAHEVYDRLSRRLGDDVATLRNAANARSALTRLAQLDLQLHRHAAAAARFERLLEARPNDRTCLRNAAAAYEQAGEPAKALPKWRALAAGLPKGTSDWFEAKFHQLDCLAQVDLPASRDAFRQFKAIYPQLDDTIWRPRFQELERRLQ